MRDIINPKFEVITSTNPNYKEARKLFTKDIKNNTTNNSKDMHKSNLLLGTLIFTSVLWFFMTLFVC